MGRLSEAHLREALLGSCSQEVLSTVGIAPTQPISFFFSRSAHLDASSEGCPRARQLFLFSEAAAALMQAYFQSLMSYPPGRVSMNIMMISVFVAWLLRARSCA